MKTPSIYTLDNLGQSVKMIDHNTPLYIQACTDAHADAHTHGSVHTHTLIPEDDDTPICNRLKNILLDNDTPIPLDLLSMYLSIDKESFILLR